MGKCLVVSACSGHGYKFGAAVGRRVALEAVGDGDVEALKSWLRAETVQGPDARFLPRFAGRNRRAGSRHAYRVSLSQAAKQPALHKGKAASYLQANET